MDTSSDSSEATKNPVETKTMPEKADVEDDKVTRDSTKEDSEPPEAETELEKYWRAVKDNPQDFTGWTYLLQYVEQENNLPAARTAFEAFLAKYPYCYGYWKKYADLEKRNDNLEKADEVFQKGIRAIALSIELWIHYLNFTINKQDPGPDHESEVRGLFERALAAAGTAFKSDKLWDMYILWEKDNKNLKNVTSIYDRLNTLPTQLYSHHFEQLKDHINKHHPKEVLSLDEFLSLRQEVLKERAGDVAPGDDEAPPGEEEAPPGETSPTELSKDKDSAGGDAAAAAKAASDDKEIAAIREKAIEKRKKIFSHTEQEVSKRWSFEEGIRRPYFHVKPLEKSQLKNWRDYLDFEIKNGTQERVMVLFERCVIACALYEEFWLKYAKYMEPISADGVRNVFRRACTIHLTQKPNLHMAWAAFEERNSNYTEAARVLENIESITPGLAMVHLRRISLERRSGSAEQTQLLFQNSIESAKTAEIRSFYAIKYSRYLVKVLHDLPKAKEVLQAALKQDESNVKLYLQLVDMEYQQREVNEADLLELFDQAISSTTLSIEHRNAFSRRKLEFLEDFGTDVSRLLEAYNSHQKIAEEYQTASKKRKADDSASSDSKKAKLESSTNNSSATTNGVSDQSYSSSADPVTTSYNYNQWNYGASTTNPYAGYSHGWGGYGYGGYGQ